MPKRSHSSATPAAPAAPSGGNLQSLRRELVEAPTFCPTAAEFENPLRYLLSIREEAERFGICCVQPPPSWKPPFMLDLNKLKFPTRVQKINELLVRKVQRMRFMKALTEFADASGRPLKKIPDVSGRVIDLHLLFTLVKRRGGFERASAERKWAEIAEHMNMHDCTTSHLSQALKKHYQQLLLPYERMVEGLDPPPPAVAARPPPAAATADPMAVDEPPSTANGTANGAADGAADSAPSGATADAAAEAPMVSSGGGLMAKRGLGASKYSYPEVGEVVKLTGAKGVERSNAEVEEVIAYEPPAPGEERCEICGSGADNDHMLLCDRCSCGFHTYCLNPPLKNVPAGDWFCSTCLKENFGFGSTRTFKFHQYERQAHAFKHAFFESLMETGTAKIGKKSKQSEISRSHNAEERAQYTGGVRLNDFDVPAEEVEWQFWNIVTTPDQPLEVLYGSDLDTLEYGSGFPKPLPKPDPAADAAAAAKPAASSKAVAVPKAPKAVASAASLTSPSKSPAKGKGKAAKGKEALPAAPLSEKEREKQQKAAEREAKAAERERERKEAEKIKEMERHMSAAKRYAGAGWNLANLCRLDRCVLAHCNDNVSGMVVPWLYVGMLFASFCWHVEDHYAHSINYMHFGAPKTWYGVPGDQAEAFEEVMRNAVPDLVDSEAGLMYKMVTMVPPGEAVKAGVKVCHLLQKPGTFVITWPRGYHAGFSHGVNCAESSNFATPDWLPWGRQSTETFRTTMGARMPCFTHELLLTTLARKTAALSAHISSWVDGELRHLIADEKAQHVALREAGVTEFLDAASGAPLREGDAIKEIKEEVPSAEQVDDSAMPAAEVSEAEVATGEAKTAAVESAVETAADAAPDLTELEDVWAGGTCPECAACKYECFLSAVRCTAADGTVTHLCPMHAIGGGSLGSLGCPDTVMAAAALPSSAKTVLVYRTVPWLETLLERVESRSTAAAVWVAEAKRILEPAGGSGGASLAEAQAAFSAGTALQMDDEHMLKLSGVCTQGASVASRSATLAHLTGRSTRGTLPTLEQCVSCVNDADALPLRFENVAAIRPVVEAGSAWEDRATAALSAYQPADSASEDAPSPVVAADPADLRARAATIDELIADAGAIPLTLPLKAQLEAAASGARFEAGAAELLRPAAAAPPTADTCGEVDGASHAATAAVPPPPSMAAIAALVRTGNAVRSQVSPSGLADLAALVELDASAQAWGQSVSGALRQKGTPLERLTELVQQSRSLGASVKLPEASISSLVERLRAAEAWLERAAPVLPDPLALASPDSLRELIAAAKPLAKVAEVDAASKSLSSALGNLDGWLARCAHAFVKPLCHRSLLEVLRIDFSAEGAWPPTDDENLACCACCTPDQAGIPAEVTWVGCDACDAWYHSFCVRVPDAVAESLEQFTCPRCAKAAGTPYAFTPESGLPPPILTTMRPSLDTAEALLEQAISLSVATPEVDAVKALVAATISWRQALRERVAEAESVAAAAAAQAHAEAMRVHEASVAASVGPTDGTLASGWTPPDFAALAQPPPRVPQPPTGPAALPTAQVLEQLREAGALEVVAPDVGALRQVLALRGVTV